MKKTALFLCSISLVISSSIIAQEQQHTQVTITMASLTPEIRDQQSFAPLTREHKMEVISVVQATQQCFQNMYDSVDKGVDTFWESLGLVVQIYGQVAKTFVPHAELRFSMSPIINELEVRLPMIKALEILPSFKDVFEAATRFLPTDKENMVEQDIKRAMNKPFRNKETKSEVKTILKKKCDDINDYVVYIDKMYAREVAEFKAQMQAQIEEILSKIQEQQGQ